MPRIIPHLWYGNTIIGVFHIPKNSVNFVNELMDMKTVLKNLNII